MANIFKRAARTIGYWTGIKARPETDSNLALIESVSAEQNDSVDSIDPGAAPTAAVASDQVPPVDASGNPWDDELSAAQARASQDTDAAIEAAIASGQFDDASILSNASFSPSAIAPSDGPTPEFETIAAGVLAQSSATAAETSLAESKTAEPEPIVAMAEPIVVAAQAPTTAEEVKSPIEIKPEGSPTGIPLPHASVSFTELYELISTEVNKRSDSTATVYERLLMATREELDATRRSNRIAWSVGGVMTAFAAFGAIWAAGEVAATRVEVAGLKQQVITGQQASVERDQYHAELIKTREASAKLEIDSLKARLDQAISVTAERDRLRSELQVAQKARQESDTELRLARAASTQPVSQARPLVDRPEARQAVATETVAGAGAERPDVWSILLNGDR